MEQRETSALNRAWNNIFVRLTVLVMLITMLVLSARLLMEYNELRERADQLRLQVEHSNHEIEALRVQLDAPFDENYVIRIAKEKLNLSLPQEIIFYNDLNE